MIKLELVSPGDPEDLIEDRKVEVTRSRKKSFPEFDFVEICLFTSPIETDPRISMKSFECIAPQLEVEEPIAVEIGGDIFDDIKRYRMNWRR